MEAKSNLQPNPVYELTMNSLKCQSVRPKYSTNEPLTSPPSRSITIVPNMKYAPNLFTLNMNI